jgi:hypothetical protein
MNSLQQPCPLPLHPFPPKNGGTGVTPTRQKDQLSGYILILQDDYRKVTLLNCLTGEGQMPLVHGNVSTTDKDSNHSVTMWARAPHRVPHPFRVLCERVGKE